MAKNYFPEDFLWGVAGSNYQIEGTEPDDGRGENMWDVFLKDGRAYEGQNTLVACDHMHRYKDDFAIMGNLGIQAYRFSISWSRIIPDGTGEVNMKAINMYRSMIIEMKKRGVRPFITLYHWEFPQALVRRGGWQNPEVIDWFGNYAKVVSENFSDICTDFITLNEPQCIVQIGHVSGEHAPGLKLPLPESIRVSHNVLRAHGQAVINLRKYAKQPIRVGISTTCGVAYPATDDPKDVAAAKKVFFGAYQQDSNWAWNMAWYCDAIYLGHYPQEFLDKYKDYLPEITEEDMKLISQPLDFQGQNLYNGYYVKAGANGEPVFVNHEYGIAKTQMDWPVTPRAFYYGIKWLAERYDTPLYLTENGMACHDTVAPDGCVHDSDRISFLDSYISMLQKAMEEGTKVYAYFLWTFMDNFEWAEGFNKRFGIVYVDYVTQKRIVKDSAFWYKKLIETKGATLSVNNAPKDPLFLNPVLTHNIWGGTRLREDYGYKVEGNDIGECWGISAHPNGEGTIRDGKYAGEKLSVLWNTHPELFGNKGENGEALLPYDRFPLLTKIIDAKDDLSIQVHPNDDYAKVHENGSFGKTECWYVLDCPENATLVIGHNAGTKAELEDMIHGGKWNEFIRQIPVHKGDFIQIDPGTVHAIKGGVLILETQQNSDITYRVYDYDRLQNGKPRQLHVEQSIDVINVPAKSAEDSVRHFAQIPVNTVTEMYSCKYYKVAKLDVKGSMSFENDNPFLAVSILSGDGMIGSHPVKKGDHLILPAGFTHVELNGNMEIIMSTVPRA